MLTLKINFIAGRYHATSWGSNVNEGNSEYPPSPWRILRAMLFRLYKAGNVEQGWSVIRQLSSYPDFTIPQVSKSHLRHYMPYKKTKTLILDAFISISEPIYVTWHDVNLSVDELNILDKILADISYLGRAESWCIITRSDHTPESNCYPLIDNDKTSKTVKVLVPDISVLESEDSLEMLSASVMEIQNAGHSIPPGSAWIKYVLPSNCFTLPDDGYKKQHPEIRTTVVIYSLLNSFIPVTESANVCDLFKRACMKNMPGGINSSTFSGYNNHKMISGHQHASYFIYNNKDSKSINYLVVYTPKGFSIEEITALAKTSVLKNHKYDIRVGSRAFGTLNDADFTQIPIFGRSKCWRSLTAYMPSRYPKRNGGIEALKNMIKKEFEFKYPDDVVKSIKNIEVSNLSIKNGGISISPYEFQRRNNGHGKHGLLKSFNLRIEFDRPINGPIAIGYASHYGLGLFIPEDGDA